MRNDTMRKKLEADKGRLVKKIEDEKAAALRKIEPLHSQLGLIDRMLAELDAFEKQPVSAGTSTTNEQPEGQRNASTDDLPSFLRRPTEMQF
jgi:hypothetical protein